MIKRVHPYQLLKVATLFTFSTLTLLGIVGGLPVEVIVVRAGIATATVALFTLIAIRVMHSFADR